MASFRTSTGINAAWRPSLAPWRSHVANLKGGPGEVVEVPAFLAFACNFDLAFVTPGFEWISQPDLDELAEQRATAERYINPEHFERVDA
jgi:hypothetical protein